VTQLTGRDYKKRSSGADLSRWREFGIGVIVGAALSAVLLGVVHRRHQAMGAVAHAAAHHASAVDTAAANAAANATSTASAPDSEHYDFYQMLPHFEVVVPEKEHPVKPGQPADAIVRPGVYVLQAGSYRDESEAQRVVRRLSGKGIAAKVQRVAVDADVWYRVRVGPIDQLAELNRLRRKLQAADVDSLVIRIGD
jgi:cell division protein FtsN